MWRAGIVKLCFCLWVYAESSENLWNVDKWQTTEKPETFNSLQIISKDLVKI